MTLRKAHLSDLPFLYDICHRTGYQGGDASSMVSDPTLLGAYFAAPYVVHNADWCWVAQDSWGVAGYLVTTPDTISYTRWLNTQWLPAVRITMGDEPEHPHETDFERWLRSTIRHDATYPDFVDRYPAHLHIDFVPRAQRQGAGRQVLSLFEKQLKERSVAGFHLGMAEANQAAGEFYRRLGLEVIRREPGVVYFGRRF